MSQPPTSVPSTNSCGIVGQPERAESTWRMRGSGRMLIGDVVGVDVLQGLHGAVGEAARRRLGRALHEQHDAVVGERLVDGLADLGFGDDLLLDMVAPCGDRRS